MDETRKDPTVTASDSSKQNGQPPQTPDQARFKLKEELRKKKEEFDAAQGEITKRKNLADKLKSDMATLDKSFQEIDKALQDYEQAFDDIKCDRDKFQKYVHNAGEDFEKSLPTRDAIKAIWKGKRDEIWTHANKIRDLEKKEPVTPDGHQTLQGAQNRLTNALLELEEKSACLLCTLLPEVCHDEVTCLSRVVTDYR